MSADPNQHQHDQQPTPPGRSGGRPAEPAMTDDQRTLTSHHAAVRANLAADPGDIGHAARTLRHAIQTAEYAFVDVPAEVRAAAERVDQWDAQVKRQLAAERAERAATGITTLAQQAAIERAWYQDAADGRAVDRDASEVGREDGCER